MTVLWFDGLDSYGATADVANNSAYSIQPRGLGGTGTGRFGGQSFVDGGSACYVNTPGGAVLTDIWMAKAWKWPSGGYTTDMFDFVSTSGVETRISVNWGNGQISAWRGPSTTLLGLVTISIPTNVWHWVEARTKFDGTAGIIEVWVNNIQVMSLTGINTKQNSGATGIYRVKCNSGGSDWYGNIDDLVMSDARVGDCRIATLLPTSDASPNNGTLSTGTSHFAVVNETPGYNTTNYTTLTNTTGQEERFGVAALPTTPATILGVSVTSWAQKSDAGTANAKQEVVSGTTVGLGSVWALSTSWGFKSDFWMNDPNTSAAWTASAVASLKIGYVVQ